MIEVGDSMEGDVLRPTKSLSGSDLTGVDDLNVRVARAVTLQLNNNSAVLCPCCKTFGQDQPLCRDGDYPEVLFCPHCNLNFQISVNGWPHHYRSRSIDDWKKHINSEGRIANGRNRV